MWMSSSSGMYSESSGTASRNWSYVFTCITGFPPHVILFRFSSGSMPFRVDLLKKMSTSVSMSFFNLVPPRRYVAALSTAFCIGVGFCCSSCSCSCSSLLTPLLILLPLSSSLTRCSDSTFSGITLIVGAFESPDAATLADLSALLRLSSSLSFPVLLLFFCPCGRSGAILGFTGITFLSVTYSTSILFNRSGISGTSGKSRALGTSRRPSNTPVASPALVTLASLKAAIALLEAPPIRNLGFGSSECVNT
mmetsp:Transcript_9905/g.28581  ORF Transcript_9905/g.28581 Transcript_9905/m.28581 type:complete len:251 (-) Transcript_9905:332-1084(-)